MSRTLGGQKRTYICPCGWGTKDSVRASDMKLRMHRKICGVVGDFQPTVFDGNMNGINGITHTRRGNMQHTPLIANVKLDNVLIAQCPLADVLNSKDALNPKK